MGYTKKLVYAFSCSLFVVSSITSCSNEPSGLTTTPVGYYDSLAAQNNQNQCCCCCEGTSSQTDSSTTTKSDKPKTEAKTETKTETKTGTKTETKTDTKTETKTETKTDTKSTASTGRKALDKVLEFINKPNAFEVLIDKTEKGLKDKSKYTIQTLKFFGRKPGTVKIEVLKHSKSSNVGAKMSYVSGTGKATVRPGGALSFIVKEFDQTDSNITSPNEYSPESCDFFTLAKRLSGADYTAEITGKITVDGKDVYLLKVVKKGTNELDSSITHEIIGFDPKTFEVKLWEAYSKLHTADEPYMKVEIKSFKSLPSLEDSIFKV